MKTKHSIPPCRDCMLIPVCRHKVFSQLIHDCSIIANIYSGHNWDQRMYKAQSILKPTKWTMHEPLGCHK